MKSIAEQVGEKHAGTGFAEKAPALFWWEALGKKWFLQHLVGYIQEGDVVYEYGSGGGRVVSFLIDHGVASELITGFEISQAQVNYSKMKVNGSRFVAADIASLDFLEKFTLVETANHIYSNMVVEWLNRDQLKKMFSNAYRALKPGGALTVMTVSPEKSGQYVGYRDGEAFTVPLPWSDRGETGQTFYHSRKTYKSVLVQSGFREEDIEWWDLQVPPESKDINRGEYARYTQYSHSRLAFVARRSRASHQINSAP